MMDGRCEKEKKEPQVDEWIATLDTKIDTLKCVIGTLKERLTPILESESERKEGEEKDRTVLVPLASTLHSMVNQVECIEGEIHSIINRLEI